VVRCVGKPREPELKMREGRSDELVSFDRSALATLA
jgi:hypothetical protein